MRGVPRRLVILAVLVVAMLVVAATPASADPWEKLFGCDGLFTISCPGPVIW